MKKVLSQSAILVAIVLLLGTSAMAHPFSRCEKVPIVKLPLGHNQTERTDFRLEALQRNSSDLQLMLGPHHVSKRGIRDLQLRGRPASADTLKILLIRIGFETDVSGDLTSVTTDGDFQLEPDGNIIDPAPHNKSFYESHLVGLSEYYNSQSGGKLVIDGTVLPAGENDCYKLSDIADYGPGEGNGWTIELLERLVIDMIDKADQEIMADNLGFTLADFDDDNSMTYVIFVHAGSDWQSDIYRDSPNDIPTFFVTLGQPSQLQSVDSETGEFGLLSECSIIPETTSQDESLGSIAGALYHEFGHALGLPDVYDTTTGLPAAGIWELMDSGPNLLSTVGFIDQGDTIITTASGLLPPSLGAWSKWYLGWTDAEQTDGSLQTHNLPAVQIPKSDYSLYSDFPFGFSTDDAQVLIGGTSTQEFFLIENRWVPLGGGEFPDNGGVGFLRDPDTGVFLYLAGDENRNTDMYDYFLPQGGLLIWHVDQQFIDANISTNTINGGYQGLRLVEADGIRDIGVYEPYVIGFYGSNTDPFHSGINSSLLSDGISSTRAIDRSWTGFEVTDISEARAEMSLKTSCDPILSNSPIAPVEISIMESQDYGNNVGKRYIDHKSVTPFDIGGRDASGMAFIFVDTPDSNSTDYPYWLFALTPDGAPAVSNVAEPIDEDWPAGAFWQMNQPLAGPPVVFSADGGSRLLVTGTNGYSACFGQIVPEDGWAPLWEQNIAGGIVSSMPVVSYDSTVNPYIIYTGENGMVYLYDADGQQIGQPLDLVTEISSVVGEWVSDSYPISIAGEPNYVLFTEYYWFLVGASSEGLVVNNFNDYYMTQMQSLWPAVVSGNNGTKLIIFTESGSTQEFMISVERTPPEMPSWIIDISGTPAADPAVADLDGDGKDDIIVVTGSTVYAFSSNGIMLTGFPRTVQDLFPLDTDVELNGSLAIFDSTGDGVNEVYVTTKSGHLIGMSCIGELLERTPLLCADSGDASLVVSSPTLIGGGYLLWVANQGSGELPGLSAVVKGGRITGLHLPSLIIAEEETSKWFGYRGGPGRSGSVGTAINLNPLSNLIDEELFVCWPNPLQDNSETRFRFYSAENGTAKLSVYNLEGELVASQDSAVDAEMINEIPLRSELLASGVYVCRLVLPDQQIRQTLLGVEK